MNGDSITEYESDTESCSTINTKDEYLEAKSLKDENNICSICLGNISPEHASKACPNSDKHDFHSECLKS